MQQNIFHQASDLQNGELLYLVDGSLSVLALHDYFYFHAQCIHSKWFLGQDYQDLKVLVTLTGKLSGHNAHLLLVSRDLIHSNKKWSKAVALGFELP